MDYGVERENLFDSSRLQRYVMPRHIAMALIFTFTEMNQLDVASMFKKNSHAVVNHSMNNVVNFYKVDKSYAKRIDTILYKINYALGGNRVFSHVEDKINHIDTITDASKTTYADITAKIKEIVEAQNPQLILILVQELKELHSNI